MNLIRILLINILIFFILIIILEFSAGFLRIMNGHNFKLPTLIKNDFQNEKISDPCIKSKTDVLLSHVPDHKNKCIVRGGIVVSDFVVHENNSKNEIIVTLGGSTTTGFYQKVSEGFTWPLYLFEKRKNEYNVYNGGIGGYSSSQELIKLIYQVSRLKNVKYIISLNGINDLPGNFEKEKSKNFPLITRTQFQMNKSQQWYNQRPNQFESVIPNLFSLIKYITNNSILDINKIKLDNFEIYSQISASERWKKNVIFMNKISEAIDAKYYVFLQPTMGLKGVQSKVLDGNNDFLLFHTLDEEYIKNLNNFYDEVKSICLELTFCFDITDVAPPDGNNYSDPRHHNKNGNLLIAEKINNIIFK